MYKLLKNTLNGQIYSVLKTDTNTAIPFDPDNTDYQEYLRWLEAGNTPEPAEENQ
jgi:hypothetical protein